MRVCGFGKYPESCIELNFENYKLALIRRSMLSVCGHRLMPGVRINVVTVLHVYIIYDDEAVIVKQKALSLVYSVSLLLVT